MNMHPTPPSIETLLAHRTWVRLLARDMSRDAAAADDLEQEVWLSVLRRPPREDRGLRAWLRRVVSSRAADRGRADTSRATRERASAREDATPPPDVDTMREETHRRVVRAVAALDPALRDAVVLRYFEELPLKEIARRLATTEDTARGRIRRALPLLREALQPGEDEGPVPRWMLLVPFEADGRGPPAPPLSPGPRGRLLMATTGAALVAVWVFVATAPRSRDATVGEAKRLHVEFGTTRVSASLNPIPMEVSRPDPRPPAPSGDAPAAPAEPADVSDPPPAEAAPSTTTPPEPVSRAWALRGRVLSRDGLPVPGARVAIDRETVFPFLADGSSIPRSDLDGLAGVEAATTDVDGRFALDLRFPAGTSLPLLARATGFVPATGSAHLAEETAGREITLRLDRAVGVEGRILDGDGNAVSGATVSVSGLREGETGSGSARTGPDGRFRLPGVPKGAWILNLSPPPPPKGEAWLRSGRNAVVQGGDRDVELVLHRRVLQGARVTVEVVDAATGEPVTPIDGVLLVPDEVPSETDRLSTAATLRPGSMEVDVAEPGRWHVWVRVADGGLGHAVVDIEPGTTEVRARIETGATGSLRGSVDGPGRGEPPAPPGVTVVDTVVIRTADTVAYPSFALGLTDARPTAQRMATVGRDGSFTAGNLIPGRYRVSLLREGAWAAESVEVRANRRATVVLRPTPSASLRVTSAKDLPDGELEFVAWLDEDPGQRMKQSVRIRSGDPWHLEFPVPPGTLRWTATLRSGEGTGPRDSRTGKARGTTSVDGGATAEVVLGDLQR